MGASHFCIGAIPFRERFAIDRDLSLAALRKCTQTELELRAIPDGRVIYGTNSSSDRSVGV
ncbi:MAG: hypothetical protein HC895_08335 [Leptolyngbyaceae cyanobacterium SM1_3_5]|nr:hypothetical protein [Leptolyngbyaceae cyanobacterium SM1_3_5]